MSSGVTRVGDKTVGHSWSPTASIAGSPNVFANGKPVVRVGDAYADHSLPYPPIAPHKLVSAQGSKTVFVNGLAVTRIGDDLSCSDKVAEGSNNIFIG